MMRAWSVSAEAEKKSLQDSLDGAHNTARKLTAQLEQLTDDKQKKEMDIQVRVRVRALGLGLRAKGGAAQHSRGAQAGIGERSPARTHTGTIWCVDSYCAHPLGRPSSERSRG